MKNSKSNLLFTVSCAALLMALGIYCPPLQAQGAAPKYEFDPTWPKPLPDHWVTGMIGGVCIDHQDHVIVLNRRNLLNNELDAGVQAPPVIEFDPQGNVVNSWGDLDRLMNPYMHACAVDKDNNIWLASIRDGILQEWSHDGKTLLLQIGKKGVLDSTDGTAKGKALNSSHTQFFRPAGIAFDRDDNVYVADGEAENANHRVAVFDHKGNFLRQWELHTDGTEAERSTSAPWAPVPHCIAIDKDDNVYVCDRRGHRFQIFDTMGNFKRMVPIPWERRSEYPTKPGFMPGAWGSSVYISFSTDPQQKYLIDLNEDNEEVTFLDHATFQIVYKFGRVGHQLGEFTHMHFAPMDSKGNLYIGEVLTGERVDKWKPAAGSWKP